MTVTVAAAPSLTPKPRALARRAGFWIAIGVVVVVGAVTLGIVQAAGRISFLPLDPRSPAPDGSRALVQVLQQQGVKVTIADSIQDASAASDSHTTVVFHDATDHLAADTLDRVRTLSSLLVVIDPSTAQLEALAPELSIASSVGASGIASPDCALPAARRADTITTTGTTYRAGTGSASVELCYPDTGQGHSLANISTGRGNVAVLGSTAALTNEHIAEHGNASLALSLLGSRDRLVWYQPGLSEGGAADRPTAASLTPEWVVPVTVLGVAAFLAAALWRGRRFGPLVAETLPVVVRSTETMEGRARLYERAGARLRALDALRMGTVSRSASDLGLPRTASVYEVIATSALILGWPRDRVHDVLLGFEPANEAELMAAVARLDAFEAALGEAVHGDPMRQTDPGDTTGEHP